MRTFTNKLKGIKPVVAGVLVGLALSSAQAFDAALGELAPLDSTFQVGVPVSSPVFIDTLTFSLGGPVTGSFNISGQAVEIPGVFSLPASMVQAFAIFKGDAPLTGFGNSFIGLSLDAGDDYSFKVLGLAGGYRLTWSVTPTVAEPASWAIALAGLGIIVGTTRRRLG